MSKKFFDDDTFNNNDILIIIIIMTIITTTIIITIIIIITIVYSYQRRPLGTRHILGVAIQSTGLKGIFFPLLKKEKK